MSRHLVEPAPTVRARRLDGHPDLLRLFDPRQGFLFERDGDGVVGVGEAVRLEVAPGRDQVERAAEEATAVLANASGEGPPPVVVGALPFSEDESATLAVPRLCVVRRGGEAWRFEAGGGSGETAPVRIAQTDSDLRVIPHPDPGVFAASVAEAVRRIRAGHLDKVVLARSLLVEASAELDPRAVVARLRAADPGAYTFAVGGFVGATPELLVSRRGREVCARPLGGSLPRGADPQSDAAAARRLFASEKDGIEHAFVVDAVAEALEPLCEALEVGPKRVMATSAVWHLSTKVRGRLRPPAASALALAARLHPTPAVCGTPRDAAMGAIRELERIRRGRYAGLIGWVDAEGDGEWAVALRCAEISGRAARLFAGAGIVADSHPEAEVAETQAKFGVMLAALGYEGP